MHGFFSHIYGSNEKYFLRFNRFSLYGYFSPILGSKLLTKLVIGNWVIDSTIKKKRIHGHQNHEFCFLRTMYGRRETDLLRFNTL